MRVKEHDNVMCDFVSYVPILSSLSVVKITRKIYYSATRTFVRCFSNKCVWTTKMDSNRHFNVKVPTKHNQLPRPTQSPTLCGI